MSSLFIWEKFDSSLLQLTVVVKRWNSGIVNNETSWLVSVGHDTVTASKNWGDVQTTNSVISDHIWIGGLYCWQIESCNAYGKVTCFHETHHHELLYLIVQYEEVEERKANGFYYSIIITTCVLERFERWGYRCCSTAAFPLLANIYSIFHILQTYIWHEQKKFLSDFLHYL